MIPLPSLKDTYNIIRITPTATLTPMISSCWFFAAASAAAAAFAAASGSITVSVWMPRATKNGFELLDASAAVMFCTHHQHHATTMQPAASKNWICTCNSTLGGMLAAKNGDSASVTATVTSPGARGRGTLCERGGGPKDCGNATPVDVTTELMVI